MATLISADELATITANLIFAMGKTSGRQETLASVLRSKGWTCTPPAAEPQPAARRKGRK